MLITGFFFSEGQWCLLVSGVGTGAGHVVLLRFLARFQASSYSLVWTGLMMCWRVLRSNVIFEHTPTEP